jgi:hypothetical protein
LSKGFSLKKGDFLYIELAENVWMGARTIGVLEINTKNDSWSFKRYDKIPHVTLRISSPNNDKFLYNTYDLTTKKSSLWVYSFFQDENKKVYDIPEGYVEIWCGEGAKIDETLFTWINNDTVKFRMRKIVDPKLCVDTNGRNICGECGESFDEKYMSEEIILNNL